MILQIKPFDYFPLFAEQAKLFISAYRPACLAVGPILLSEGCPPRIGLNVPPEVAPTFIPGCSPAFRHALVLSFLSVECAQTSTLLKYHFPHEAFQDPFSSYLSLFL